MRTDLSPSQNTLSPVSKSSTQEETLSASEIRALFLSAGADDVGFVHIERPEIDDQRADILRVFPRTKTLVSYVCRMNREAIRSPARSVANLEFHHAGVDVNEVGRAAVRALEERGIRALNPAMGFPMEMDQFPGKIWVVSHKPVAVAAGLGKMGIHRNVIHPKFGNFILLGTVLIDATVSEECQAIDYNPCLDCKLCVAACPVGAISPEGDFNFSACYTHNYREFMGGFTDWVEQVADSRSALDYRKKVNDSESASMWQSLSYGANYKAAYCLAVCPAGEDVIQPFLDDKKAHVDEQVRPFLDKKETIYVLKNSDAEDHVRRQFPHKSVKIVGNSLRVRHIKGFLGGLPLLFQAKKSKGINTVYHFQFTGQETGTMTAIIRNQKLKVLPGHHEDPDLTITADTKTWFAFLAKETGLAWALLTRKIKLKGSPKHLLDFGRCFPL